MDLPRRTNKNPEKKTPAFTAVMLLMACCAQAFCCGGGYVPLPYVPTSSGNINTPSARGSFFLIEKGSAGEMFDVKRLHPLFRNIHQSGNERKARGTAANAETDSSAAADTARTRTTAKRAPVLNLQSIH